MCLACVGGGCVGACRCWRWVGDGVLGAIRHERGVSGAWSMGWAECVGWAGGVG